MENSWDHTKTGMDSYDGVEDLKRLIRRKREAKGWSRFILAQHASTFSQEYDVEPMHIEWFEIRAQRLPKQDFLRCVCQALGITNREFLEAAHLIWE